MENGATETVTVRVAVDASARGTITNTASVSSATTDPDELNNMVVETTVLEAEADLSTAKSDLPDPVIAGTDLSYVIAVTNSGPSDATGGGALTDTLPVGVGLASSTPSQGSCTESGSTVTCTLGELASGETTSVSIQLTVAPSTRGMITNTATATANEADPDASNNTATADTAVSAVADLSITQTGTPELVIAIAGTDLRYTLTLANNGPSDATGATVTDELPSGVTHVTAIPSQGGCTGTRTVDLLFGHVAQRSIEHGIDPAHRRPIDQRHDHQHRQRGGQRDGPD